MSVKKEILLPGGKKQLEFFLEKTDLKSKSVLVMGSASELIAEKIFKRSECIVHLIVEESASLMSSLLKLEGFDGVKVKLMDFCRTDFPDNTFDAIYAQASVSNELREDIINEFQRILKKEGTICIGEIISLRSNLPTFVSDVLGNSGIYPLTQNEIRNYYEKRGLEIIDFLDLTETIKTYYQSILERFGDEIKYFSENDLKYQKKEIKRLKHESKVFTKLGGDKYIGFNVLNMRK